MTFKFSWIVLKFKILTCSALVCGRIKYICLCFVGIYGYKMLRRKVLTCGCVGG